MFPKGRVTRLHGEATGQLPLDGVCSGAAELTFLQEQSMGLETLGPGVKLFPLLTGLNLGQNPKFGVLCF